ncbi:unnamed protein product, partial [Staurois parvus]
MQIPGFSNTLILLKVICFSSPPDKRSYAAGTSSLQGTIFLSVRSWALEE